MKLVIILLTLVGCDETYRDRVREHVGPDAVCSSYDRGMVHCIRDNQAYSCTYDHGNVACIKVNRLPFAERP